MTCPMAARKRFFSHAPERSLEHDASASYVPRRRRPADHISPSAVLQLRAPKMTPASSRGCPRSPCDASGPTPLRATHVAQAAQIFVGEPAFPHHTDARAGQVPQPSNLHQQILNHIIGRGRFWWFRCCAAVVRNHRQTSCALLKVAASSGGTVSVELRLHAT